MIVVLLVAFIGLNTCAESTVTSKGPTRFFTQVLDHFDPQNSNTWQQRYFIRNEFFEKNRHKQNAPVFLCVGGEGPPLDENVVYEADENVHCSLMVQHAKEKGALIVALEHRFYGESNPT